MAKALSAIITDARQIIGQTDSAKSNFSDSQLTVWINDAYRRGLLEMGSFPWTSADATTTTRNITVPAGTVTIDVVKYLVQPINKFMELQVISLEELIRKFPDYENEATGIPEYFVRTANTTAIVHPAPNAANQSQTCRMWGLTLPTELSASTDQPSALVDNLHDCLSHWAAFRCFQFLERPADSTQQLILFNQILKSQRTLSQGASRGKSHWWFEEVDA